MPTDSETFMENMEPVSNNTEYYNYYDAYPSEEPIDDGLAAISKVFHHTYCPLRHSYWLQFLQNITNLTLKCSSGWKSKDFPK